MELQFDSLSPQEAAASSAKVIITTRDEADIVNKKGAVMLDTELERYPAITKARILRSILGDSADDQLTVGIDPGSRIGISALYLHREIASAVDSSPQDAIEQVSAMLGGAMRRMRPARSPSSRESGATRRLAATPAERARALLPRLQGAGTQERGPGGHARPCGGRARGSRRDSGPARHRSSRRPCTRATPIGRRKVGRTIGPTTRQGARRERTGRRRRSDPRGRRR